MLGTDLAPLRELLGPSALVGEFVDLGVVQDMLRDVPSGTAVQMWAIEVWRLATLELWMRHLMDGGLADTLDRLRLAPADLSITSSP
jgi:hypothetical protein